MSRTSEIERARVVDTADRPIPIGFKKCTNEPCRRVKPIASFWRNKNSRDGHANECISCMKGKNAAYRETEAYRQVMRNYNGSAARKRALKRRKDDARYKERQSEYEHSDRGKLLACARRSRTLAKSAKTPASAASWTQRATLYTACAAALDPTDEQPVPKGAKRCPSCMIPKPLKGGFYVEISARDGFTEECRSCLGEGGTARKRTRDKVYASGAEGKLRTSLRRAVKRLQGLQLPWARAMTERTAKACRAELDRMADARNPGCRRA